MAIAYYGTTTATWLTWCANTGTSDTCSNVWYTWSAGTTTYGGTTAGTCDNAWTTWIAVPTPVRQATPEEKAERERLEEVARREREEAEKTKKLAEEKALNLLLENLTKNQAEIFKMTGAIPVESPSGRKYRINKGTSRNIEELDDKGQRKACLCFHPCDWAIPVHDVMLAQKLMLEASEEEARKIANFS